MAILLPLLIIVLSCIVIWKASDGFETASEYLGRNLSEGVRGATINAIGSSIPELFTAIFFLVILHNQEGFSGGIGTTAGSAIFNAMVIPATVILAVLFAGKVKFVKVSRKVVLRDGIMLLLSEFILIYLLASGTLYWWHGLVLMLLYGVYVVVLFATMKKSAEEETVLNIEFEEASNEGSKGFIGNFFRLDLEKLVLSNRDITTKSAWVLLLLAVAVIGAASAFLVLGCEELGVALNIPIYFVAVILAAAATSVPDTILSIKDARKGNYDDAVSNALSSNIFDICFALGFPLFLYTIFVNPIQMDGVILENVNELRILLLLLTTVAFFIFFVATKLKVLQGVLLFAIYVFFVFFILGKSLELSWIEPLTRFLHNIFQMLL